MNTTSNSRAESADTRQSSQSSEGALPQVSDDEVNYAYNLFHAESMRHYRQVRVGLNKNFRPRKTLNPYEWSNFVHVLEMCRRNGFNPKSYIKYCFINRLAPHGKGRTIADVSYLLHYPQIADYSKNRASIEKLYAVYMGILKSVLKVRAMCEEGNMAPAKAIKGILSSGYLCSYVSSGAISRHFLSIIPNITTVVYECTKNSRNEERHLVEGLCETLRSYAPRAMEALDMFWPEAASMSVVELCAGKNQNKTVAKKRVA